VGDSSSRDQTGPVTQCLGSFEDSRANLDILVVTDDTIVGIGTTSESSTSSRTVGDQVVGRFSHDGSDVIIVKSKFVESFIESIPGSKELPSEGSLGSTESIGNEDDYGWGSFVMRVVLGRDHAQHDDYVEEGSEESFGLDEHLDSWYCGFR